jgi:putative glutamine amidotransferase
MSKLIIGVTDCSKYSNYSNWIEAAAPDITIVKLSSKEDYQEDLARCNAIVFTGGEDVHPAVYNKPDYLPLCYPDDISIDRDEFEMKLMQHAEKEFLPVLGICRGLQFINVYYGGTLIPDIPSWGKYNHSKTNPTTDRYHKVSVDVNSWLYSIVGKKSGTINSAHHQSADRIGKGLVANAFSKDGIIEGLEKKDPANGPFLCLVQWHPERMTDQSDPFVIKIREAFIDAVRASVKL